MGGGANLDESGFFVMLCSELSFTFFTTPHSNQKERRCREMTDREDRQAPVGSRLWKESALSLREILAAGYEKGLLDPKLLFDQEFLTARALMRSLSGSSA